MVTRRLESAATHLVSSLLTLITPASEIEIEPLQTHYIILIGQLHATATRDFAADIWCGGGTGCRGGGLELF